MNILVNGHVLNQVMLSIVSNIISSTLSHELTSVYVVGDCRSYIQELSNGAPIDN